MLQVHERVARNEADKPFAGTDEHDVIVKIIVKIPGASPGAFLPTPSCLVCSSASLVARVSRPVNSFPTGPETRATFHPSRGKPRGIGRNVNERTARRRRSPLKNGRREACFGAAAA